MQIGLIGLSNKGLNLGMKLKSKGHDIVSFDGDERLRSVAGEHGIKTVKSLKDLSENLSSKRVIWLMIPSGDPLDVTIESLKHYLSVSDVIIHGEDSSPEDTLRRNEDLAGLQIDYLDCGFCDGGNSNSEVCAVIGGNRFAYNYCEPMFHAITDDGGHLYCGRSGSGHFVKMVYDNIQSRMQLAVAEGFEALQKSGFNLKLDKIGELWNRGSAIQSRLIQFMTEELKDQRIEPIKH